MEYCDLIYVSKWVEFRWVWIKWVSGNKIERTSKVTGSQLYVRVFIHLHMLGPTYGRYAAMCWEWLNAPLKYKTDVRPHSVSLVVLYIGPPRPQLRVVTFRQLFFELYSFIKRSHCIKTFYDYYIYSHIDKTENR